VDEWHGHEQFTRMRLRDHMSLDIPTSSFHE
jgi:hypothetical protein